MKTDLYIEKQKYLVPQNETNWYRWGRIKEVWLYIEKTWDTLKNLRLQITWNEKPIYTLKNLTWKIND